MAKQFIYQKLKRHPGIWRVDGIGLVSDRGRLGTGVLVHYSEIFELFLDQPYSSKAPTGKTLSLKVHCSTLSEFIVGSLWKNGGLIQSPQVPGSRNGNDRSITIDVSQARFLKLEEPTRLNGRRTDSIIPRFQYNFGANRDLLKSTIYVVAPVLGDPLAKWVVIPCSELLRFYYGVSSRLLSSTLRGLVENYVAWDKSHFKNGVLTLHINRNVNRTEACVLARAVATNQGRHAMQGIHSHLSSNNANNRVANEGGKKSLVIKAGFPFNDSTVLTVAGKRINIASGRVGEQDEWGIYVMEILKCNHSLGFSWPAIIKSDLPLKSGAATSNGGSLPPGEYPFFDEDPDDLETVDAPANANFKRLAILNYSNQFSAMEGMRFQHVRPQGLTSSQGLKHGEDVLVDALSFSDGSHSEDAKNTLGAGSYQNDTSNVNRDISLFLEMIRYLRKKISATGWSITTRGLKSKIVDNNEIITFFPMSSSTRKTWHKITEVDGSVRPRQVVIAELKNGPQIAYLLEMELKPDENGQCTILLCSSKLNYIQDETFKRLLKLTAIKNRWLAENNTWKDAKHKKAAQEFFSEHIIYRINHPSTTKKNGKPLSPDPKKWSIAIKENIAEIFG